MAAYLPNILGKEFEVKIGRVHRGYGIAKMKGCTIYVPNAKTGDRLKVKIIDVNGRFCIGQAVPKNSELSQPVER